MNPMDTALSERILSLMSTRKSALSAKQITQSLSPTPKKDVNRVLYKCSHLFKALPGTPPLWTLAQPDQEGQHKKSFKQVSDSPSHSESESLSECLNKTLLEYQHRMSAFSDNGSDSQHELCCAAQLTLLCVDTTLSLELPITEDQKKILDGMVDQAYAWHILNLERKKALKLEALGRLVKEQ